MHVCAHLLTMYASRLRPLNTFVLLCDMHSLPEIQEVAKLHGWCSCIFVFMFRWNLNPVCIMKPGAIISYWIVEQLWAACQHVLVFSGGAIRHAYIYSRARSWTSNAHSSTRSRRMVPYTSLQCYLSCSNFWDCAYASWKNGTASLMYSLYLAAISVYSVLHSHLHSNSW